MTTKTIWKTITTTGKKITKADLEKKGYKVSDWADDLLQKVKFSTKKEKIDLVVLKVSDLGFTTRTRYADIIAKAKEMGYDLCPPEVGPLLRIQYKDQPSNEWITIAMEPIAGRGGDPGVFTLARFGDGLWLGRSWAGPDDEWRPDDEFAFRLRKGNLKSQTLNSSDPLTLDSLKLRVEILEDQVKKLLEIINI